MINTKPNRTASQKSDTHDSPTPVARARAAVVEYTPLTCEDLDGIVGGIMQSVEPVLENAISANASKFWKLLPLSFRELMSRNTYKADILALSELHNKMRLP